MTFQVVELKPGGRDVVVTNQNRIEYIHLMADYRLNKQVCDIIFLYECSYIFKCSIYKNESS